MRGITNYYTKDEIIPSPAIKDAQRPVAVPVSLQGAAVEEEKQAVGVRVSIRVSLSAAAA